MTTQPLDMRATGRVARHIVATDSELTNDPYILNVTGMTNEREYMASGTVLWDHGRDTRRQRIPIARCLRLDADSGLLRATTLFAEDPFSLDLYDKLTARPPILNTWSLYALPVQLAAARTSTGKIFVEKWSLIEYSLTPTPADSSCVTESFADTITATPQAQAPLPLHGGVLGSLLSF